MDDREEVILWDISNASRPTLAGTLSHGTEYLGDDEDWGFAIYHPATETCTPSLLRTGQLAGHPSEAFDAPAITHLADYKQ